MDQISLNICDEAAYPGTMCPKFAALRNSRKFLWVKHIKVNPVPPWNEESLREPVFSGRAGKKPRKG
jgi:hypothetical protein